MNESNHSTFLDDQNGSTQNPAHDIKSSLNAEIELVGDEWQEDPAYEGAIGRTMFDLPNSKDNLISVLVPMKDLRNVPSQALVRIRSRSDGDGRTYLGIVVEGPFNNDAEIELVGDEWQEDPAYEGAIGRTMFDLPNSKDNLISVLVPMKDLRNVPSQALVRIRSRSDGDGRTYLGIVVEGPFNIPNGLRADSQPLVLTTVYGATFMPPYHGRVAVEIIAEIVDGRPIPPRFRPLPNSPVEVLGVEETRTALRRATLRSGWPSVATT